MTNFRLNTAISARGKVNRKDFSLLQWQLAAFRQANNGRTLQDFLYITSLIITE